MDVFKGERIERQDLFGGSSDQGAGGAATADSQDVEMFEEMMKARLAMDIDDAPAADAAKPADDSDVPVFRMFAGAKPVKVETAPVEPVYILPKRPEVAMEESDSEEHRQALISVAIDAQTIRAMAQIPVPALQFPKRVLHLKAEATDDAKKKSADKPNGRRKHPRRARKSKNPTEPYVRVLSPYTG
ncbi:hypothetical protein H4R23_004168, partial [Coemansia sp. Cherry 401B]